MDAPGLGPVAAAPAAATAPTHDEYARHSAYSDPGAHAGLLAAIEPEPREIGAAARAAVVHYRAGGPTLTAEQREDPDRRWLASILDAAVARRPGRSTRRAHPGSRSRAAAATTADLVRRATPTRCCGRAGGS
ncbi:hypothetical protein [Isoptericola variabilis]|uniref:Uncharacterized protein n=1 Tax=Isoptericola variabilis (strain 225) TaxID=743718 RepID=F6FV39_ISOV2|nr:hypothetical protein [Isoptericola variabilis]AEG45467.1 hypothetical protein Isova_2778 [Isoptericola variabilis 225]TWH33846.1 hypothetical protein L600_001500000570 [Isoptericola variabilis J7]